jgi:hypothetical protein
VSSAKLWSNAEQQIKDYLNYSHNEEANHCLSVLCMSLDRLVKSTKSDKSNIHLKNYAQNLEECYKNHQIRASFKSIYHEIQLNHLREREERHAMIQFRISGALLAQEGALKLESDSRRRIEVNIINHNIFLVYSFK